MLKSLSEKEDLTNSNQTDKLSQSAFNFKSQEMLSENKNFDERMTKSVISKQLEAS